MFALLHRRGTLGLALLLLASLSCSTGSRGGASRVRQVFIFAGQSNMAGADSVIPDPPGFVATEADRRTLFTGAPLPDGARSADFYPWGELKGHRCTNPRYGEKLVQGPEVGFARQLHAGGVRDIAIIKVWANFSREAGQWPWAEGGELNRSWLAFVDQRLEELRQQGFEPRVSGFVWHQGIDDAIHGKLAAQYRQNLAGLIAYLRQRYHAENAPFVLARSGNSPIARGITGGGATDPMAVVRQAQVNTGETVPNAAWINVDDLPNVVQHHFSAQSQLVIGQRFGEAYLRLAQAATGKNH